MYHKMLCAIVMSTLSTLAMTHHVYSQANEKTNYKPIALVNDAPITPFDLTQRIAFLRVINNIPDNIKVSEQDSQKVLNDMISERIKEQETTRFKIEVDDDRLSDAFVNAARSLGISQNTFEKKLNSGGLDKAFFNKVTKQKIAWDDLIQGRYARDMTISSHEVAQIIREKSNSDGVILGYTIIALPYDGKKASQKIIQENLTKISSQLNTGQDLSNSAKNLNLPHETVKDKLVDDIDPKITGLLGNLALGQVSQPLQIDNKIIVVQLLEKEQGNQSMINKRMDIKTGILEFDDDFTPQKKQELFDDISKKRDLCSNYDDYLSNIKNYPNTTFSYLDEQLKPVAKAASEGETRIIQENKNNYYVLTICKVKEIDYYYDVSEDIRKDVRNQILMHKLALKEKEYLRDLMKSSVINLYRQD